MKNTTSNTPTKPAEEINLSPETLAMAHALSVAQGVTLGELLDEAIFAYLGKPMSLVIPPAIIRLSRQLKMSPEDAVREILSHGLRSADWNLANGCEPFDAGADYEFDVTEAMAGLTRAEIDQLESDGEFAQCVLYAGEMRRQGVNEMALA